MFESKKINESILEAYLDLFKGFEFVLGQRHEYMASPKFLVATTCELVTKAKGVSKKFPFDFDNSTYETCGNICERFAQKCNPLQKEMILLIIDEILNQWEKFQFKVSNDGVKSDYLFPLEIGNPWGNLIIALMDAFGYEMTKERRFVAKKIA